MLQFKCSFANSSTLIIFFLIHIGSTTEAVTPTYISHFCENSTSSTTNSSYSSNLETLLHSLSSSANHVNDFYYATAGRKLPNVVFGLFLCRGDVSNVVCQDCVNNASKQITKLCPTEKGAIIWYEECLLRYSDEPIFAIPSVAPATYLASSINNATENDQFELLLAGMINTLAAKAVNIVGSGKKISTGQQNFSDSVMMYGLVQCTPDLSEGDCSRCFRTAIVAIPSCCSGKQSVKLLLPSCFIMYDSQPFYNETLETPPPPPLPDNTGKKKNKSSAIVVAIVVPVAVFALLSAAGCYFYRRRARKKYNALNEENVNDITTIESVQYEIKTIETATDKFSEYNKLGRGGFGEVYKGILVNGREIAVKRLSKSSGQGAAEFKNEVALVAKLQHRNLVRLLGFCLEGEEKILVYEYVANKSLDYFLFDPTKQGQLNWSTRCNIIEGIARGILYLHEDSRLKIIHRDLKASNILLDKKMNAKVADFGMAKMFGVDQTQGNTRRIVGTYGYMAPEYAMEGLYSVKSDVFSFGVLLLEILSGRRNTGFHLTDRAPSLVAYAWQLWNEEKCLELMDLCLKDSCLPNEFIRYVHIGLLCVQEDATKRPTMSSVALMLKSEAPLAQPERPAFFASRYSRPQEIIAVDTYSANGMTVSDFLPR